MRDPVKIIQQLMKHGHSQKEIADMIGKAPSTISRMLAGGEPRLDTCKALWAIPQNTLRRKKPDHAEKNN